MRLSREPGYLSFHAVEVDDNLDNGVVGNEFATSR